MMLMTLIHRLGSSPEIEMKPNGSHIFVDKNNLEIFIQSVREWILWKGIGLQVFHFYHRLVFS